MKKYDLIDSFPLYNFLSLWKLVLKYSYKKYESKEAIIINDNKIIIINQTDNTLLFTLISVSEKKCIVSDNEDFLDEIEIESDVRHYNVYLYKYVISPKEKKYFKWDHKLDDDANDNYPEVQVYQMINEEENLTYDFLKDLNSFAFDWTKEDTISLLEEFSDYHLNYRYIIYFMWLMLDVSLLNRTMSSCVVQCKAVCLYIINNFENIKYSKYKDYIYSITNDLFSFEDIDEILSRTPSIDFDLYEKKGPITVQLCIKY